MRETGVCVSIPLRHNLLTSVMSQRSVALIQLCLVEVWLAHTEVSCNSDASEENGGGVLHDDLVHGIKHLDLLLWQVVMSRCGAVLKVTWPSMTPRPSRQTYDDLYC